MKTKTGFRHKQQKNKLHKLMVSVSKYVKNEEEQNSNRYELKRNFVKKKSRKEKRREKRKAKKAKLKKPADVTETLEKSSGTVQTPKPQSSAELKRKFNFDESAEKSKNKSAHVSNRSPDKSSGSVQTKAQKRKVHFGESAKQSMKMKMEVKMEERRRALLQANEDEDREIKRLEKRLGYNKRRNKRSLPQSLVDDGLDYILGILQPGVSEALLEEEEEEEAGRMKSELQRLKELRDNEEEEQRSGDDLDAEERNEDKIKNEEDEEEQQEEEQQEEEDEQDEEEAEEDEDGQEIEEEEEKEEEEGITKDENMKSEEEETSLHSKSLKITAGGKYVPPPLRAAEDSKRKAELERLKRNLKGLINRLSEANLGSISGQVEQMYMSCSRKDMNDTLTDLLLSACVTPALMPDRLLMEHMLLLSVLHHTVGLEVGANFLETVVRRFEDTYDQMSDSGKQCDNLVCMLAHLYNFQVFGSLLLFDLLRRLLDSFRARDLELMLLLLKNVGFALRKDDPLALKELITEAQRKASTEGQQLSDQTRVRFMLETMLALKNNDMRKIPGYDPEPVEKLRKLQRSLVHQRASGTDVKLRVSLENLLKAEQVGRWWIVGSSWTGAPMISNRDEKVTSQPTKGEQFSAKVLELARKQRMNTDVRKNIFCVIMTSEDYLDAFEKLIRLGLKGQQERDIVHVLLDCCLQEKNFNGFYAVLAEKFCTHDRRFQMTFQFCLWDKFKDLQSLSSSSFSNLVQMVTHLLHKNSLSLSLLKAIEFGELDKPKVKFLRQVLSKLLQQTQPEDLVIIFSRISGIPKLEMLREGLKLFITHFLLRTSQTQQADDLTALLTDRAEIATKAMEARDTKLRL